MPSNSPIHQFTVSPIHQFTNSPIHRFTISLFHQSPIHQFTTVSPLHHFTNSPFHHFTKFLFWCNSGETISPFHLVKLLNFTSIYNHDTPLRVEMGDRRIVCFDVSSYCKGNTTYFKNL